MVWSLRRLYFVSCSLNVIYRELTISSVSGGVTSCVNGRMFNRCLEGQAEAAADTSEGSRTCNGRPVQRPGSRR
jgi:hypothetical protein